MKKIYEKPAIVKQPKTDFALRGLKKIRNISCRACSSCHGCR